MIIIDWVPGFFKYRMAFMASLDVKAVFHVAKPSAASKILSLTRVHGHMVAACLAEMQVVRGSACFDHLHEENFAGGKLVARSEMVEVKCSPVICKKRVRLEEKGR